jgi:hypothetical protein
VKKIAVAVLAGLTLACCGGAAQDPLQRRAQNDLSEFTSWLEDAGARGFIGEVGWPHGADAGKWNALAERWYAAADDARLWVTAWATGEWWGDRYPLAAYERSGDGGPVDTAEAQAKVVERHASARGYMRGINDAGGAFGAPVDEPTSEFSNRNPGRYGVAYHYDSQETLDYLADRAIDLIRLPFRWERLQPRPGQKLDPEELARIRGAVRRAHRAGLDVILDMHNYGAYYLSDGSRGVRRAIGSSAVSIEVLADAWRRIAAAFGSEPGVLGYDLMNEPVGLPAGGGSDPRDVWDEASQAALDAIRAEGDDQWIFVEGYGGAGTHGWAQENPQPWIHDPAGRFFYEAHQYFDPDRSGTYRDGYDEDLAALEGS